jgi:SAM-dependent methyltransferase
MEVDHADTQRPQDGRDVIYKDLHETQLVPDAPIAFRSASKILNLLFDMHRPASILDVGCGLGIWLSVAQSLGVEHIQGVEGPWLDPKNLRIDPARLMSRDLENPFDLNRRYDLVISLEVAEHLRPDRAAGFVENLIRHGDTILFSAAIPYQGGHNHLNEQWPAYWAELFQSQGYRCLDVIRPIIWEDKEIFWHLRQNILLFVSERSSLLPGLENAAPIYRNGNPAPLVHPDAYCGLFQIMAKLDEIRQRYDYLINHLSKGGMFHVDITNGELNITRPQ